MSEAYGKRLMASVLVNEAHNDPLRVFSAIPASTELGGGFRDITFKQINTAVDEVVRLLLHAFGDVEKNTTITYIGIPDLRYPILFYAALKCRYKVFLPSPRNPVAVNKSLMEQTNCRRIVSVAETTPIVNGLKAATTDLVSFELPELNTLLEAQPEPVPYDLEFAQVKDEPVLVLHSSGSTGTPKPVTMTHGTFAAVDNDRNVRTIPGRHNHDLTTWDFPGGGRLYAPFPPFHLAGFFNIIMVPLYSRTIPVLGSALRLPTGGVVADILRSQEIRGCFLPPTLAADLYKQPGGPELLKSLDVLCVAGGPLSQPVGDDLVKHVALCQFYGSTEVGQVRQLRPLTQHWEYMEFHPDFKLEFQPAEDGAYEMVVYADDSTADTCSLNHNFPGLREYRTKDLFRQHPTQPGLWKFHARRDDILVLSSGEKLNPLPMEEGLAALPGVIGALVIGAGRARVGLLVELAAEHKLGDNPVSTIWPKVSALNAALPSHGHITKSMIRVADPKKPFTRAGKGSVVRKLTVSAYKREIDDMFNNVKQTRKLQPSKFQESDVTEMVRSIFQDILESTLAEDDDLISLGLDSVKSIEALNMIKSTLPNDAGWLSLDTVYSYPTVRHFSSVLLGWLNNGVRPVSSRVERIEEMLKRYVELLPSATSSSTTSSKEPISVMLVGSTGFLGRHLLATLARDPHIGRVWCLNRSPTARQQAGGNVSEETMFLQVDFLKSGFGLSQEEYDQVATCDVIIHSAWQVNFVLPLQSFQDSLKGLMSTIKIATSGGKNSRILFISSIGATGISAERGSAERMVPEAPVTNFEDAMRTGYAESKLIAEQLIAEATARSGLRASVIRFGLVAPTSASPFEWPTTDSLVAMLQTSKMIQCLPTDVIDVHWIPVDAAGRIVRDIIHYSMGHQLPPLDFYNAVNPVTTQWSDLVPVFKNWMGSGASVCRLEEWINEAEREIKMNKEPHLPVSALLSFFKRMSQRGKDNSYSVDRLLQASESARALSPIGKDIVEKWLGALH